jgi:tetratricopeptide (TPR) repeat protein
MVDELTVNVKNHLKLTEQQIASDYDKDLGVITTGSQEAYRYYKEGRELFGKELYQESISLMERAISIDPEFAMAYRSVGSAYHNIYLARGDRENLEKKNEYLRKALEIAESSERISHKEKLIIQGHFYAEVEENFQKAGETFDKLTADYPEDQATNTFVGWHSYIAGDWDRVIQHYGLAVKYGSESQIIFYQLGDAYCAKGMYEKARELYRKYIANVSDDAIMHRYIANSYVYEGKYQEALDEVDKVIALNPNMNAKGGIYHLKGDFKAAERDYISWLGRDEMGWKMSGRRNLEFLYRMLGQYEKAKKEAEAGLGLAEDNNQMGWKRFFYTLLAEYDLAKGDLGKVLERAEFIWKSAIKDEDTDFQTNALWRKIQVHLEQNDIEKSLAFAEEAGKILESTPSTIDDRWYLDNLGLIEMKRENYPEAIELFAQAYELQGSQRGWFQGHAYILSNLASAYYLNGDLEMARKEYENILVLTTGRWRDGDLYVKSFYMLGKINEELGDRAKAIENYERFLDLWKDADPGIAEVEDARKRLAGLKGD